MKKLLILLLTGCLTPSPAYAQKQSTNTEIELWPGVMPDAGGARGPEINNKGSITQVSKPRLIAHVPEHPNGIAMLVISGGGYAHIETGKESSPAAEWLKAEGVTAFELIYRLPQEGWKTRLVPFEDAQRAMRIIRSQAKLYHIDPHKIGVLGFSAGGHLAGITATLPDKVFYPPVDDVDATPSKPDFAALIYPVISMLPPNDNTHSHKSILGKEPSLEQETAFSVERQVKTGMGPVFLAQAADDPVASVENSLLMFAALKKETVLSEMHIFQAGGHGWGMGKPGSAVSSWPQLFKKWLECNGILNN
ncbi:MULTISPECIES: alpha/beta hydrolase [Chryseobacterium]|uniref:Acetyl esterase/lipase n=1 Tax=Chryseobacterium camelliae TaxID=1265445 RepID=A0ABU0TNY3_9FLAO|nr:MULTISPECIES: alpha/beta hydrolase [Chryseobacterium]MDT3408114.1 acetyl esterase/lipase [Pseudacidovorax intermedius]MDQ1098030.1 acetyl esterase/lipase [Chryseobacterium camelliae]MDQ1101958.1 acetyl esterase/lipase [Chryseobacterium sp. SORGH_AS_1048]MDR6085398.1 acetyl esterase/lipase [Chryseobacterium sp. SORGH_AS_0909]MDR6129760.1 acetyl esterase/lipase [Chryseobacterium sp. SORGH_AS_1175]